MVRPAFRQIAPLFAFRYAVFKVFIKTVAANIRRWHASRFSDVSADSQAPLRSELFTVTRMEQHGKALASTHVLSQSQASEQLLKRLDDNKRVLTDACALLTAAVRAKRPIPPAGEWLLDNFYLIEEQIRTAKQHLPKGYSRELPQLAQGPSLGLPRVYDLALEEIAHGDGEVEAETLSRYVRCVPDSDATHAR